MTTPPGPWGAVLYDTLTTHVRTDPPRPPFRHRGYLWLVDPDRLPRVPWPLRPLASFRPRDHRIDRGAGELTIRQDIDRYLAEHGVRLGEGRILMLTQARSLGHVFNPLTVYWCRDGAGHPLCTVVEVHNTYGGRHRYLLPPDPGGRAETPKDFYVSPFFPVDGRYRMVLPEPGERLALTVHLDRGGGRAFTATVRGTGRPAGPAALLRAALAHPLATWAVSLHIRYRGVRLWLSGLPVHPRPTAGPDRCAERSTPTEEPTEVPTEEVPAP
ncbi:DUF1365 domain-containing protein [Kitasatospora sp. NBC_01246]|uniref:DUF1365 domain-containing protein n=1 Tax=Kitasatospora sp. NBC_01246 TaxID=2903570 RepID=UPI002E2F57CC|nr:DUF1365 domain-containing protein [Kitasatospora sp. NBC_01246]